MSPEVLKGKGYEWRSDVWSLGCILYELAMLKSPFKEDGLNLFGLFQKITQVRTPTLFVARATLLCTHAAVAPVMLRFPCVRVCARVLSAGHVPTRR
ncbi:MAG: hypothetical protein EOO41_00890 [Methanobacteriota archaeon]|nr:MAG: hypothetical protein EOO41_00890 [Euryarchaeota archaeon]